MFYNNKGAIALVNKQYDLAYNYFRNAVKVDSSFSAGWGNLGVLFRQLNYLAEAEQAYTHAILLNQNNNTAQGNLAALYQLTGRSKLGTDILKNYTSSVKTTLITIYPLVIPSLNILILHLH
ncbi:hypothetical protein ATS73_009730 [Pseudoalteromonas sp. H100]|nr:hypothetical protein [Pseudoalteromonas sp. H100]WFO18454.1 hypothetical protein ATS73_009730 [Pseudoalteromonas sp. H100]